MIKKFIVRIRTISLLLFVILTLAISFFSSNSIPSNDLFVSSDLILITEIHGNQEIYKYLNSNNELTFAYDKEYAVLIRTFDDDGRVILEQYFDENEMPFVRSSGYHAISYTYCDNSRVMRYLDSSLSPVSNALGCYGIEYLYEDGLNYVCTFIDQNSNPMTCIDGYSKIYRTYYDNNYVKNEMYFDIDNSPVADRRGQYGRLITYYSDGKWKSVISLNASGGFIVNREGYSRIDYTYNEYGIIETERYYDLLGNPCRTGKGWYGVRHNGNRIYYLDKNGHVILTIDSVLHNFPFVVIIVGLLACIALIILPKKLRAVLLGLYFLFILYETLYLREVKSYEVHLTLFESYRNFFTDSNARLQIIDNIWLFVPYGCGVYSLFSDSFKKRKLLYLLFLMPLFIEVSQLVFQLGYFEVDDIFNNGLGEMLGVLFALLAGPPRSTCAESLAKQDKTPIVE